MVPASKIAATRRAAMVIGLGALGCMGWVAAQEPARSARGGVLAKAGGHQFEVFFYPTGLRVFPADSAGKAIDAANLSGTATFYHPNSSAPWFSRPLRAADADATSLDLSIHLTTVPPTGARVEFEVAGLPGSAGSPATFVVPVVFVKTAAEAAAAQPTAPQAATAAQPTFVYGPGAAGYGYYAFPGPQAAPARTIAPTTVTAPARSTPGNRPSSSSSGGGSRRYRDWTTGRNLPLARPWLGPND
jgi:hypothetical protein